jgi:ribosome-associated toxin RatA of RatAB toxin-antitoxin module
MERRKAIRAPLSVPVHAGPVSESSISETSQVRISTLVSGEPLSVYRVVKDVERFPEFMPQIRKIKVLWRLPTNRQIAEWEVEIEGTAIQWKEEETYDDTQHTLAFRTIEGDYKAEGRWIVEEVRPSQTRLTVEATFDWGLPRLGKHVAPVLERKAKEHLMRMVAALRRAVRTSVIYG